MNLLFAYAASAVDHAPAGPFIAVAQPSELLCAIDASYKLVCWGHEAVLEFYFGG